jgi:hypothetical protein
LLTYCVIGKIMYNSIQRIGKHNQLTEDKKMKPLRYFQGNDFFIGDDDFSHDELLAKELAMLQTENNTIFSSHCFLPVLTGSSYMPIDTKPHIVDVIESDEHYLIFVFAHNSAFETAALSLKAIVSKTEDDAKELESTIEKDKTEILDMPSNDWKAEKNIRHIVEIAQRNAF